MKDQMIGNMKVEMRLELGSPQLVIEVIMEDRITKEILQELQLKRRKIM